MMATLGGATRFVFAIVLFVIGGSLSAFGEAITYSNSQPELQMWSYPAGSANGTGSVRDRGPTFGAYSGVDDSGATVFFPGSGLDPSRRGSVWIAGDTSVDVPVGLDPSRYQIASLRVTTTLLGNLINENFDLTLPYDNTLDDALALTTEGGDDQGHPIEMYGIGLQGDYQTIGFTDGDPGEQLRLGDARWRRFREGEEGHDPELPPEEQAFAPYQYYALDLNGADAENSVAGGYSATGDSGFTEQFTPAPFAIGRVYDSQGEEFAPGTLTNNGDLFVFEPNLDDPRVIDYVQQSLSEGHLGFSFSSMHQPSGHTGTVAYPDFYLDDLDVGPNPDGAAPTIEFVVTILDPVVSGDFDGNGLVNQDDYAMWAAEYGGPAAPADANGDGVVDAADYTVWRDNLAPSTIRVPEPGGVTLVAIVGLTAAFCGVVRWFVGPPHREDVDD